MGAVEVESGVPSPRASAVDGSSDNFLSVPLGTEVLRIRRTRNAPVLSFPVQTLD